MFDSENLTRTPETEADYRKRASQLLERFASETGVDWDLSPEKLVSWLSEARKSWSPAYWRRNRAALVWHFTHIAFEDLAHSIRAISTKPCPPPTRTSARKKKSISDDELLELTNFLLSVNRSAVSTEAYNFLVSSILTGMRPVEWGQCELQEILDSESDVDEIRLIVQNAKTTNGRAHGSTRTLSLRDLHPQERMVLLDHWRSAKQHAESDTYLEFQRRCSDKIRYAVQKLWPSKQKRIALYSSRHQSMANCKKSGLPLNVIAAIHGHATDRTASEHYGRTQHGNAGQVRVHASQEDVARVREVPRDWTPPERGKDHDPTPNR